ncbi:hypothetical protein L6452_00385 [Arctium lappa]|uniref:Uncharacterized protein n=1 Tax=Arctium lappa TaxID=4217 RepID=A0ACB9FD94_ARCLA|nr:hypothetical protein L6452_00385 [Arctium lappa]
MHKRDANVFSIKSGESFEKWDRTKENLATNPNKVKPMCVCVCDWCQDPTTSLFPSLIFDFKPPSSFYLCFFSITLSCSPIL